jgi:hypothetical protein
MTQGTAAIAYDALIYQLARGRSVSISPAALQSALYAAGRSPYQANADVEKRRAELAAAAAGGDR